MFRCKGVLRSVSGLVRRPFSGSNRFPRAFAQKVAAFRPQSGKCCVDANGDIIFPTEIGSNARVWEVTATEAAAALVKATGEKAGIRPGVADLLSAEVGLSVLLLGDKNENTPWPTFGDAKQKHAVAPHVLFQRDQPRFLDITDRLVGQSHDTVSFGLPGIGKSTEVNSLLMKLVANMGKEGYPATVLYRTPRHLYEISLGSDGSCTVKDHGEKSIKGTEGFTEQYSRLPLPDRPVLIMELDEAESDPTSFVPTFVSVSTREADDVTKTMSKSGGLYSLMSPPSRDQVLAMGAWIWLLDLNRNTNKQHPFYGLSLADALKQTADRVDELGPVPRLVFASQHDYEKHKFARDGYNYDMFSAELKKMNLMTMPKGLKLLMAACCTGESSFTGDKFKFAIGPLSRPSAMKLASLIQRPEEVATLQLHAPKFVLEEMCTALYLMGPLKATAHWYNGTQLELLCHEDRNGDPLALRALLHFHPPNSCWQVAGKTYQCPVWELLQDTLYLPTMHNFAFCDMFHLNLKTKTVRVYQVSSLTPAEHKKTMTAEKLKEFMNNLHMFEGEGLQYKLVYVYVRSAHLAGPLKVAFSGDMAQCTERVSTEFLSLQFYPSLPGLASSQPDSP